MKAMLEVCEYGLLMRQDGMLEAINKPVNGRYYCPKELRKMVTRDGKGDIARWTPETSGYPETPAVWKNRKDLLFFVDQKGMMNGSEPNNIFPMIFGNILIIKRLYLP